MSEHLASDLAGSTAIDHTDLRRLLHAARESLRSGHLDAARETLASLAEMAQASKSTSIFIECLGISSVVEATAGQAGEAWMRIERAEALARDSGDRRGVALVHITRATLFEMAGQLEDFEREARLGRREADELHDPSLVARADMALAVAASIHGDMSAALLRYGSAMANFHAAGDSFFAAVVQTNIGRRYIDAGEPSTALEYYESAAETLSHTAGPLYLALAGLAWALAGVGRADEAMVAADRARDIAYGFGPRALGFAHHARGAAFKLIGDKANAFASFHISEALTESVDAYLSGGAAIELASLYVEVDRIGDAFAALDRASARYEKLKAKGAAHRLLQRMDQIRTIVDGRLLSRVRQVDAQCQSSRSHSERVRDHCLELADHLEVPAMERHWLGIGSLLHDIGYSAIPHDALVTGPMNTGQRMVQQLHCIFGDELLQREGHPRIVRDIVRHHHERWDGTGYPDGLAREEIPRLARIVGIAERYAALRSPRGDRPGLDRKTAINKLGADHGAFDPELVSAFSSLIAHGEDASDGREAQSSRGGAGISSHHAWDTPGRIQEALGIAYVLGPEINGGGMSRLFRARDPLLEREVVVKVLPPEQDDSAAKRFRREMSIAANLAHPRILPILHAGMAGTVPYFVMPYVSGGSVRELMHGSPLELSAALPLLRDVAEALSYAHAKGVVHRDIKPGNVLLSDGRALLADFGIARQALGTDSASPALTLTDTGEAVGTVGYMAPEQLLGDGQPAPTMDVYSFGVVAYEMLSGAPPFSASTMNALMFAHITKEAPPLSSVAPHVPLPLAGLVDASLRKLANERPRDGSALVAALS